MTELYTKRCVVTGNVGKDWLGDVEFNVVSGVDLILATDFTDQDNLFRSGSPSNNYIHFL